MKALLIALFALNAFASIDQIEREDRGITTSAPEAVLVKVNPENKTVSVYQVPEMEPSLKADKTQLEKMSAIYEVESNKVAEFTQSTSELDNDSSTPAWCWRGNWYGNWRWNNWCGWNSGYNFYNPWVQPGRFYWYNYSYSYVYGFNRPYCNYGWYW